ncbi:uncharacterized protein PRCAT00005411001 [Priceomyces carsonii]|uniref:uncharacterized protein n=1 Tax=Priceomyces carsonii TaxID=28549 RepID=UPI002ED90C54|nr:unnamed protein product [Priceomyces carsonii]
MALKAYLLNFIYISATLAANIHNVFQSLSISNPSTLNRPQDIRTATLSWKLETGYAFPNDVFSFSLPYVFRTKYGGGDLPLVANGKTFATCTAKDGSYMDTTTFLNCTVGSVINNYENIIASGKLSFDFVFNAGGSSSSSDLESAKHWHSGTNNVEWGNLSTTVSFDGGPFFKPNDNDNNKLVFYSRSTPQNFEQIYALSGTCRSGISSGTIGISTNDTFDCSKFKVMSTNSLNDFYLPKSDEEVSSAVISCSSDNTKLIAKFKDIEEGERVFVEGFQEYEKSTYSVKHEYYYSINCADGSEITDAIGRVIKLVDGTYSSSGSVTEKAMSSSVIQPLSLSLLETSVSGGSSKNTDMSTVTVPGTTVVTVPCPQCLESSSTITIITSSAAIISSTAAESSLATTYSSEPYEVPSTFTESTEKAKTSRESSATSIEKSSTLLSTSVTESATQDSSSFASSYSEVNTSLKSSSIESSTVSSVESTSSTASTEKEETTSTSLTPSTESTSVVHETQTQTSLTTISCSSTANDFSISQSTPLPTETTTKISSSLMGTSSMPSSVILPEVLSLVTELSNISSDRQPESSLETHYTEQLSTDISESGTETFSIASPSSSLAETSENPTISITTSACLSCNTIISPSEPLVGTTGYVNVTTTSTVYFNSELINPSSHSSDFAATLSYFDTSSAPSLPSGLVSYQGNAARVSSSFVSSLLLVTSLLFHI